MTILTQNGEKMGANEEVMASVLHGVKDLKIVSRPEL